MSNLRPYQIDAKQRVYAAWHAGHRNALMVKPTGAGKTRTLAAIVAELSRATCVIAHRQELVSQLSVALAREGVRHGLVAPKAVQRAIVQLQIEEVGASYFDPTARTKVAGVDTLVRMDAADPWFAAVGLWVQDEAHHVQEGNKWGKAAAMFPNALGLGVTATPCRTDGAGLGRGSGGVFDAMVLGPQMRELIEAGYLTDYRVICAESDVDYSAVGKSAGGDLSLPGLRAAVHRSTRIVGDVVREYLKHAAGKRGVTFAVDVQAATELAAAYNAAGVPAAVIDGTMGDSDRIKVMRLFASGRLLQLCNCDLLGEGVDVPAIEVVSMARKTLSYSLFAQQFGRALRPLKGKDRAIIIDHVGNFLHHGPPDRPRVWSLGSSKQSRGPGDAIPLRACSACGSPYERIYPACIWCGHEPAPVERSTPQQVDGDLQELSPEALAALRAAVDARDGPPALPVHMGPAVVGKVKRDHFEAQQAQAALRQSMAQYGGIRTAAGESIRVAQRRFFHEHGIDVLGAMALGRADAEALRAQIDERIGRP